MPSRERISVKGAKGCATHAKGRPQASFVLASIGKRPRVDCTDMILADLPPLPPPLLALCRLCARAIAQIFQMEMFCFSFFSPALALAAAKYRKYRSRN